MVRSVFQRPARTLLLLGAPARRSPGAGVGDLGPDPEDEAREWRIADRVAKSPTSGASHRIASQPPLSDVDRGEGEDEFGKKAYYHQVPIYGGSGAPEHLHHQTTNKSSKRHPQIIRNSPRNHAHIKKEKTNIRSIPKSSQTHPKLIPTSTQTHFRTIQSHSQLIPGSSKCYPNSSQNRPAS